MHFRLSVAAIATLCLGCAAAAAQDGGADALLLEQEKMAKDSKDGWEVIPMPIVSYNSDLGFQFGAYAEIFNYGRQPSFYPQNRDKFHIEGSYYTKGQILLHGEYDSKHLIPGVRVSAALTWQTDPLYPFYGLNGAAYDASRDKKDGIADYSYRRSMVRFLSSFQGEFTDRFNWVTGLSFWHFGTGDIDPKFGYDSSASLYNMYCAKGVLGGSDIEGSVMEIKAGLSYDSRDNEVSPRSGISSEVYLNVSPGLFASNTAYLKLCAHWRQYWTPGPDWMTLAYHLAWQGRLAGEVPFYMLPNIYQLTLKQAYCEGLGGINTVRGMMGARLVGDGLFWANFEGRFRLCSFELFGQTIKVGVNPFFDMGCITNPYKAEETAAATGKDEGAVIRDATRMHCSAGLGLKLGMNANYIMSIEAGRSFVEGDGPMSLGVMVNYVF